MGNGISIWAVLVIVVIVAVIASLVTGSITGNTIKLNKDNSSTETYTKDEVDAMMKSMKEELSVEEESEDALACDIEKVCEVNQISASGQIVLSDLSYADSPLRTNNAYVCVDRLGKLYRGTSTGCR